MRDSSKIVARSAGATALAGVLALLSGCEPEPPPVRAPSNDIVAAVRPGPASWFPGADGQPSGFDHDLLVRFALEQARPLRIVTVASAAELLAKVERGEVDIGVGGLIQAESANGDPRSNAANAMSAQGDVALRVLWTAGIHAIEPVLIYNVDSPKPKTFSDLQNVTVAYAAATGLDTQLATLRYVHPEATWE